MSCPQAHLARLELAGSSLQACRCVWYVLVLAKLQGCPRFGTPGTHAQPDALSVCCTSTGSRKKARKACSIIHRTGKGNRGMTVCCVIPFSKYGRMAPPKMSQTVCEPCPALLSSVAWTAEVACMANNPLKLVRAAVIGVCVISARFEVQHAKRLQRVLQNAVQLRKCWNARMAPTAKPPGQPLCLRI